MAQPQQRSTVSTTAAYGVLLGVLAAFFLLGPWVPVLAVLALAVPAVRRGARALRPVRLAAALVVLALAAAGLVVLVPEGRLPIPPGAGLLVTSRRTGGQVEAQPVDVPRVPAHPWLAPDGSSGMHVDPYSTDTYPGPGPLGRDPEVDTAWYGVEECATLAFDRQGRLVAMCGDLSGPTLRVLDPESMRPLATRDLPDRPPGGPPAWKNLCAGAYFYLDRDDRAVVATTDRRILVLATSAADGSAALTQDAAYDLDGVLDDGSCLVALMPDWAGRVWFVASGGARGAAVGFVDPDSGAASVRRLAGEEVANSFSVDEDGGVYVVSDHALYRFTEARGRPVVSWREAYDRGSRVKPGQLDQGSGTTPTLLAGGLVAITDNADPRMHVLVYDRRSGRETCRVPVFAPGHSATENSLVAVGDWLVVENNEGYAAPWSTVLGRATSPGVARVDVAGCRVAWTSREVAPSSVPKASAATGLVYVYTTRRSLLGVSAWYLTAIDLRTGRTAFSVRTGIGSLFNNHYAAVTLAPDGTLYVATLGGLVRVRDSR